MNFTSLEVVQKVVLHFNQTLFEIEENFPYRDQTYQKCISNASNYPSITQFSQVDTT